MSRINTEYKLEIIHTYGKTVEWNTISDNCGITVVCWKDNSYNIGAFGKNKLDAIDNLYFSLMKEMNTTVKNIERC